MADIHSKPKRSNLAVLFDADNISKEYVKAVLDACARYGRAIIKRSYGDWAKPNLKGWDSVTKEFAIKPIQQSRLTKGKNVTDSAMTIDAMDILHSKDVDVFVLVSSDSDFTALATRIREDGLRVIGVGRTITPRAFVNACDEFLMLEHLTEEITLRKEDEESKNIQVSPNQNITQEIKEQGRELLIRALKVTQDESGLVKGAALGVALRRIDPAFAPKTYGVSKLADFVGLYPDVLELQGRRTATDPTYKSKL